VAQIYVADEAMLLVNRPLGVNDDEAILPVKALVF
jgi:hypothetical protein